MSGDVFETWARIRQHNEMIAAVKSSGASRQKLNDLYDKNAELIEDYNNLAERFNNLYDSNEDQAQRMKTAAQAHAQAQAQSKVSIANLTAELENLKVQFKRTQELLGVKTRANERAQAELRFHEGSEIPGARESGYLAAITEARLAVSVNDGLGKDIHHLHELTAARWESIAKSEQMLRVEYARLALGLLGKSEDEITDIIAEDSHAIMTGIQAQFDSAVQKIREKEVESLERSEAVFHYIKDDLKKGSLFRAVPPAPYNEVEAGFGKQGYTELLMGRELTPTPSSVRKGFGSVGNHENNDLNYTRRLNQVALGEPYRNRILYTPHYEGDTSQPADAVADELKAGLFPPLSRPEKLMRYTLAFAVLDEYIRGKNKAEPLTNANQDVWRARFLDEVESECRGDPFYKRDVKGLIVGHVPILNAPANMVMTPEMAFNFLNETIHWHGQGVGGVECANPFKVNTGFDAQGFDGNGYLFHLIYAGAKGSSQQWIGLREQSPDEPIYNDETLAVLHQEYNWMMPQAANEFLAKHEIRPVRVDLSGLSAGLSADEGLVDDGQAD